MTNRRARVLRTAVAVVLAGPLALMAHAAPLAATPLCGKVTGKLGNAPIIGKVSRQPIKVATFNALHGLTEDGDRTLDARQQLAITQLAASGVDIIGTQEITDSGKHGPVYAEIADGLAKATGYTWYYCFFRAFPHFPGEPETRDGGGGPISDLEAQQDNPNDSPWSEGNAIFSKYLVIRGDAHRLPGEDSSRLTGECLPKQDPTCVLDVEFEARAAVWVRLLTGIGVLDVTVAHTSGTVAQHNDLMTWLGTVSAQIQTSVMVCDCNSHEADPAMAAVRNAGWVDTYRALHKDAGNTADQNVTAAKSTVSERIDYVFLRQQATLTLKTSDRFMNKPGKTPLGTLWPSDHYGVIVTLAGPPSPF